MSGLEISEKILRRSGPFEAIRDWCASEVEVVRQLQDRETIVAECRKYNVHFQGAEVADGGNGMEELLLMPFYDPSFV